MLHNVILIPAFSQKLNEGQVNTTHRPLPCRFKYLPTHGQQTNTGKSVEHPSLSLLLVFVLVFQFDLNIQSIGELFSFTCACFVLNVFHPSLSLFSLRQRSTCLPSSQLCLSYERERTWTTVWLRSVLCTHSMIEKEH